MKKGIIAKVIDKLIFLPILVGVTLISPLLIISAFFVDLISTYGNEWTFHKVFNEEVIDPWRTYFKEW